MHWRQFQELQRVAEIGERYVSYVDRGAGPPLVLLHGFPTWGYLWHRLMPLLENHHRVLIPDLPGYGWSDKSDRFDRSIVRQAEHVAAWLNALGVTRADFAGHDIGGAIALRLAEFHAESVERLVLIDAACYDAWPSEPLLSLGAPEAHRHDPAGAVARAVARAIKPGLSGAPAEDVAGLLVPYATEAGKLSLTRDAASLNTSQTMELVPSLTRLPNPALILWGADDPFQPVTSARRLAADLQKATLAVLPGGHFLPLERPQEIAEQLGLFLRPTA